MPKISVLPAAAAAQTTDLVAAVQGGITKKETLQQIINLFSGTIIISESQVTGLIADLASKLAKADNLSDLADIPTAVANLGLTIGVDTQAWNANLDSISALGTAADKMIYTTGVNTWAETDLSAFSRSLFDEVDAAAWRTALGVTSSTDVLLKANNLSDVASIPTSVANLGLTIGVNTQAYNANLQSISALGTAANKMIYTTALNTWAESDISAFGRLLLNLAAANNGVLLTDGAGVPSIGSTLPTAVQSNITQLGAQSQALNMNTHLINNVVNPVSAQDAATKNYVDNAVAGAVSQFVVRLASTSALTATYSNGSSGVGATLTNAGAMVALSLDGIAVAVNDRVLIKDQASAFQNGIYVVTAIGSGAANWVLTRATDYDQSGEILPGDIVTVNEGNTLNNSSFRQTATVNIIGTDSVTFAQYTLNPSLFLLLSGGTMTGVLNMGSHLITNVTDPSSAQDAATKAYVDSKVGSSVGLLSNLLFNSTFVIGQRGNQFTSAGTYPNNDAVYLVDGWVHLSDGNNIVNVRRDLTGIPTAWGGNRYECTVTTANKQFGGVQFVESLTPQSPIFEDCTLTALLAADLPGTHVTIDNIRFAIIEWTGAVNAMTRDPISAWAAGATLPTLAANWAYVANHAEITLDTTSKFYKISGTTSSSAKNVALIWWCSDSNATVNDQLAIYGAWLFTGDITAQLPADGSATNSQPDNFLPTVTIGYELRFAQRYFQKTFDQATAPASNVGSNVGNLGYTVYRAGAVNNFIRREFPVVMRTAPTIASFNPEAAGTAWYNHSTAANSGAYATQAVGDSSLTAFNGGVAGDALSGWVVINLTMTAEL